MDFGTLGLWSVLAVHAVPVRAFYAFVAVLHWPLCQAE